MEKPRYTTSGAMYGLVGLVGAFVSYWGVVSLTTPSYVPSITFPWLDRTLTAVGQYVWIPAIGVLLLAVSASPLMAAGARKSWVARLILGSVGIAFIGLGGALTLVTLSPIWGLILLSPLVLTGALLLAIAVDFHGRVAKGVQPS